MNHPSAAPLADADPDGAYDAPRRRRLRFELIFASAWLVFGLFVLPALIYAVGMGLLGPYAAGEGNETAGLGAFYGDFFGDLAEPSGRAWAIALGPLLLISLVRAMFIGTSATRTEREGAQDAALQDPFPPAQARRSPPAVSQTDAPAQPPEPAQPAIKPTPASAARQSRQREPRAARIEPRIGSEEP